MRAAGAITGFLILGTFVIPGSYVRKIEAGPRTLSERGDSPGSAFFEQSGSAAIAGRVYGPSGDPLPGVRVTLAGSGFWPPRSVQSDSDGRFSWSTIPAGVYELRATSGTLASVPVEGIILNPGARRIFGLRLAEGWTLAGEIHDATTGAAVTNATVHVATGLLGAYTRETETNARGSFEIAGILGPDQTVYVDAPGYVPSGPLPVTQGSRPLDVRLERGATIRGRVADARGQPIEGVSVRAFGGNAAPTSAVATGDSLGVTSGPVPEISTSGVAQLAIAEQAITDPNGDFELSGLRSGSYVAVANLDGYAPAESPSIRVGPGTDAPPVRIVLFRGYELRGRVVDLRGRPLSAIPVELRVELERLPRMAVSGHDGTFAFRSVRGRVTVTALPYDLQPATQRATVDQGNVDDVELVLGEELVTLEGRIVDERGDGIAGALVTATSTGRGSLVTRSAKSEADGSFAVPALPDPPYDLRIEHAGYSTASVDGVGEADDVEVVLATGVTLLGRVIDDWTSDGLQGADVSLIGPETFTATTRKGGQFAFRQVPIAVYDVVFSHPDYESQSERVELEPPLYVDRPQELRPVRLAPGGSIEGEVRDLYGEPVPGAEVSWEDPPNWERAISTDAQGRFALRGVPSGAVWLTARHPIAGEASSSNPVTVRPLETTPSAHVILPNRLDVSE